jgi:DNA-binding transcriptional ArsR family regulator
VVAQYPGHDTPKSPVPASAGRRQSLAAECSWADVARAIASRAYADDVVPAARADQVAAALDAITDTRVTTMRSDGRRNLARLLQLLAWGADWYVQRRRRQLLVSIPQAVLAERLGTTDRTVRRHLRLLESVGLLATVREGTTDEYRPPHMAEGNVVPVYLLLLPVYVLPDVPGGEELLQGTSAPDEEPEAFLPALADAEAHTAHQRHRWADRDVGESSAHGRLRAVSPDDVSALVSFPVDTNVRPSLSSVGGQVTPTRTRESDPQEPLRGTLFSGAVPRRGGRHWDRTSDLAQGGAARRGLTSSEDRSGDRWPAHATPARRSEVLAAADELRTRVLALRVMSPAYVRHITREFFLAGWNVLDLQHAVDWRPDGAAWTQDSLPWSVDPAGRTTPQEFLARRAAAWLAHRLAAWRDDAGTVRRSRHQQLAADQAEAAARRRAAAEHRAAEEARLAQIRAASEPHRAAAVAIVRDLAGRRRTPDRRPVLPPGLD